MRKVGGLVHIMSLSVDIMETYHWLARCELSRVRVSNGEASRSDDDVTVGKTLSHGSLALIVALRD